MEEEGTELIHFSRPTILKLIQQYKAFPCLWSRDSEGYTNKSERDDAWNKITEYIQQYELRATRVHIHRKIESLRATHRKERVKLERIFKKRNQRVKSKLWYYYEMSFLNGKDVRRPTRPQSSASECEANSMNDPVYLDVADNYLTQIEEKADNEEMERLNFSRPIILKLIQKYKAFPCLWSRDSEGYTNKSERDDAWNKITEYIQQYELRATKALIHRKIESLRASHRNERNKLERIFKKRNKRVKSTLWYYYEMSFLNGKDVRRQTRPQSSASECDANSMNDPVFLDVGHNSDDGDEECVMESYPEDPELVGQVAESEVPMLNILDSLEAHETSGNSINLQGTGFRDQYDAIGVNVAAKLRTLPKNMRIICEKLINDALFAAQMHTLTPQSRIINYDPIKYE